ncbi:hypothetical protein GCM10028791_17160 [Echinicola sediminis]
MVIFLQLVSCSIDQTVNESEKEDIADAKGGQSVNKLTISVPCEGNSWVYDNPTATNNIIVAGGIKNWTDSNDKIRTYFYAKSTGTIDFGILGKFSDDTILKVTLNGVTQEHTFPASANFKKHYVGSVEISQTGYYYVELEGGSTNGSSFGEISNILLGDNSWSSNISYVESFYWGRRGPSVHLSYTAPTNKDITWFYNELTVPVGKDPVGSYFMADGFSDGYFGMQVNSATERRILFSVWSAYDTNDPNEVPEEYTVELLGYGDGVYVGEFGNEGSGGQSSMIYPWVAGNTYRFLLKGESVVNNATDYTAYFFAPEVGEWKLIASWRRPYPGSAHLTGLHSFLENFDTTMGDETRQVEYTNQWVYDTQGTWRELTTALFTTDGSETSGIRLDFDGGIGASPNSFYLRNGGFFSDNEVPNTSFTRSASGTAPIIDFSQLEVPTLPAEPTILDRTAWSVVGYSTQEDQGGEGSTGRAADILDGDVNTYWHSCWSGSCVASYPHQITVDMGQNNDFDGFRFVQRQSLIRSVKEVEILVSHDNSGWASLGDFVLQKTASPQDIDFPVTQNYRYFKFIAKSSYDGTENASMAEIMPFTR